MQSMGQLSGAPNLTQMPISVVLNGLMNRRKRLVFVGLILVEYIWSAASEKKSGLNNYVL